VRFAAEPLGLGIAQSEHDDACYNKCMGWVSRVVGATAASGAALVVKTDNSLRLDQDDGDPAYCRSTLISACQRASRARFSRILYSPEIAQHEDTALELGPTPHPTPWGSSPTPRRMLAVLLDGWEPTNKRIGSW
jgi:hypothetical protein